jgi:hypothetical protein
VRPLRDAIRACALALAAALVLAGCGGGSGDDAPAPGPRLFGFNDNSVAQGLLTPAADARLAKRAGANSARVTMDWRYLERRPGEYDWSFYDKLYRAYVAVGLRPVWIPMFAPDWAAGKACPPGQDCHVPPDPAHDRAYAELLERVAERYPKSAGLEVWNEPNYVAFWTQPDPRRYAQVLCAGYRAVKRAAPGMSVVSGGLGNKPVDPSSGDVSLKDFATGVFRAGGGRCLDAIGIHPYPLGPDVRPVKATLDDVRRLRRRFGFPDRPLWVTEIGVSTTGGAQLAVTPREQASELARLYRQVAVMPDVEAFFLHSLVVPPGPGSDPEAGYGIFEADLQPKPAFSELRRARLSG